MIFQFFWLFDSYIYIYNIFKIKLRMRCATPVTNSSSYFLILKPHIRPLAPVACWSKSLIAKCQTLPVAITNKQEISGSAYIKLHLKQVTNSRMYQVQPIVILFNIKTRPSDEPVACNTSHYHRRYQVSYYLILVPCRSNDLNPFKLHL